MILVSLNYENSSYNDQLCLLLSLPKDYNNNIQPIMNKIITVNAIIINSKNELLVVRKNKHFLLPGGKPEPEETNIDALSRELKEETGLELIDTKEFKTYEFDESVNEDASLQMNVYIANVRGEPIPHNEISEILWLDESKYNKGSNFPKRWWDVIFYDLKKAKIITFDGQK